MSQLMHEIDLYPDQLVLDLVERRLRVMDTHLEQSITAGSIERTMTGASTLSVTVHDPDRALLRSNIFNHAIQAKLDRLEWTLVHVSKSGDDLTLTFEDAAVNELRKYRKPRKAKRSEMTRAQFALSLVREARPKIPFVCPELLDVQPVAGKSIHEGAARKGETTAVKLTTLWEVGGGAKSLAVTMAAIALAESGGKVDAVGGPNTNGTYDYGLWQINSVHKSYDRALLLHDPAYNAQAAVAIERSQGLAAWTTYRTGAYKAHLAEAKTAEVVTPRGKLDKREVRRALPFHFYRGSGNSISGAGGGPDTWSCLQALAQGVNWRCFCSIGQVWFVSETYLLTRGPTKVVLNEDNEGVLGIDFDVDNGKARSEVTVTTYAADWTVPLGALIKLEECGPATGLWLVEDMRRELWSDEATITLKRPTSPLPEPAAETQTVETGGAGSSGAAGAPGGSTSPIARCWTEAMSIDRKNYPYVWGGGHAKAGTPDTGQSGTVKGYDCSGSVVAVLAAQGLGFKRGGPTAVSGRLASWGQGGKGKYMTVYANAVHTFIVFHTKNGDRHWGTGRWGQPGSGPHFQPQMHPTAGFTARHWPGT